MIDVQNATFGPKDAGAVPEFRGAATRVISNIVRLLAAYRRADLEVIYTVMETLTEDGRDRSLDYKLSGIMIAKGSWEAKVVAAIAPARDEIVLAKTSSSVFNSTNLDYLLRNMGIEDVFVTGFLTDQCIDHAVKDGADRGLHQLRARRLHRRDGSAAPGGAPMLQGLLPYALDRPGAESQPLFNRLPRNGRRVLAH